LKDGRVKFIASSKVITRWPPNPLEHWEKTEGKHRLSKKKRKDCKESGEGSSGVWGGRWRKGEGVRVRPKGGKTLVDSENET